MAAKSQGMNPANTQLLIFAGFGLLFYNKIFGKSEKEKEAAAEEKKLDDLPVDTNPLMQTYKPKNPPKGYWILRRKNKVAQSQATQAAREIKAAIGTFTDDESKIVNAMKRAVTKSEINLIARIYAALYKRDLNYDLKDNLGKNELLPIFKYINKLPDFIKE